MAGGGQANGGGWNSTMQAFPQDQGAYMGANPGGATVMPAGSPATAQQAPTGLQAMLQRLAAQGNSPQGKAAMGLAGNGMQLAQMGQHPQAAPMPAQRPMMGGGGPPVTQIAGNAAQGASGLTPNSMSQLLLRGLMGGQQ